MTLALSSMWAVDRFDDSAGFAAAAAELGFDAVEYNYEAPPAWFETPQSILPIGSLHNTCPMVRLADGRWSHQLSYGSLDEDERRLAVELCKRTIQNSNRSGATAVVLHVATIPVDPALQTSLIALYERGETDSTLFIETRDRLAAERAANAAPYLEQSIRSVRELSAYAAEHGVTIGIESRYNLYEIPNIDETRILLDAGKGGAAGFWHDVGHTFRQERLGFATQQEWLDRYGAETVGVHLHEIIGVTDHFAVGRGDMPWRQIVESLPVAAIRVCEFDRRNPPELVRAAVARLREIGIS